MPISKLKLLRETIATTRNWRDPILFKAGIKRAFRAQFREGEVLDVDSPFAYNVYMHKMMTKYSVLRCEEIGVEPPIRKLDIQSEPDMRAEGFHTEVVSIDLVSKWGELRFLTAQDSLSEIIYEFSDANYRLLNCSGKVTVEIGANVGGNAVLLAKEGASHVHAYEPNPSAFRLLEKNIALNQLQDRITAYREAVGTVVGLYQN